MSFLELVDHVNQNEYNMKCTARWGGYRVEFLDVIVESNEDSLLTKVTVAGNLLLNFQSYHPKHIKRSLPFSRFLRQHRINK